MGYDREQNPPLGGDMPLSLLLVTVAGWDHFQESGFISSHARERQKNNLSSSNYEVSVIYIGFDKDALPKQAMYIFAYLMRYFNLIIL